METVEDSSALYNKACLGLKDLMLLSRESAGKRESRSKIHNRGLALTGLKGLAATLTRTYNYQQVCRVMLTLMLFMTQP